MMRRLFNLAWVSLAWMAFVCGAPGCSSSRYWSKIDGPPIVASEDGKVIQLRAVDVREPYDTPFATTWHHVLIQDCSKNKQEDSLPCWPARDLTVSQARLREFASDVIPDYRRTKLVLKGASEAAPRLGVFGRWIVATRPLVVAFFDDPPASAETYKERALGRVVAASQPSVRRGRHDGAAFVSRADLDDLVTVIVLFGGNADAPDPSKVFTLRSPTSLRKVIELACDLGALERACAEVRTVGTAKE